MKIKLFGVSLVSGLLALAASVVLAAPALSLVGYDPVSGWGLKASGEWAHIGTPTPAPTATPTIEATPAPEPTPYVVFSEPLVLTQSLLSLRGELIGANAEEIKSLRIVDSQNQHRLTVLPPMREPGLEYVNLQSWTPVATDWVSHLGHFYIRATYADALLPPGEYRIIAIGNQYSEWRPTGAISGERYTLALWGERPGNVVTVISATVEGGAVASPPPPEGHAVGANQSSSYAPSTPTPLPPTPTPTLCATPPSC